MSCGLLRRIADDFDRPEAAPLAQALRVDGRGEDRLRQGNEIVAAATCDLDSPTRGHTEYVESPAVLLAQAIVERDAGDIEAGSAVAVGIPFGEIDRVKTLCP